MENNLRMVMKLNNKTVESFLEWLTRTPEIHVHHVLANRTVAVISGNEETIRALDGVGYQLVTG